jgi:hypothetical protein
LFHLRLASSNRRAWTLAKFGNFALTCFAHHTLNSNFINFHTPNGFLPNITIVPYIKTFPTITHMIIFGFGKWYFRRVEHLGIIMECTWNLDTQAIAIQTTRPIQLGWCSACIYISFWALHAPVQAHAWRIQIPCTWEFTLLAVCFAINRRVQLHSNST